MGTDMHRTSAPVLLVAFVAALLLAFMPAPMAAADPLAGLAGKKRVVLMFAKSRSDASSDRQLSVLQDRRGELEQRQLVVITVLGDNAMAAIGYASLPAGAGRDLRRKYEPNATGLTVILIGKDGMEKGRWGSPVSPDELLDMIDQEDDAQAEAAVPVRAG